MEQMAQMLDLSQLSGDGDTKVLSGKQRGIRARADYSLETFDSASGQVTVKFAPDVQAITPSFVLGMFGVSVKAYGSVDAFFQKYEFEVRPNLLAQIRRGAEYSLLKGDPLPF
jgi:hypothetical protein